MLLVFLVLDIFFFNVFFDVDFRFIFFNFVVVLLLYEFILDGFFVLGVICIFWLGRGGNLGRFFGRILLMLLRFEL